MVGDELDLLGKQPRVDGVQYRAHARDAIEHFHVPVAVPGQGADPLAGLHAEVCQGIGQLSGTPADVGVRAVMQRAVLQARGYLDLGVRAHRVLQYRRNE
ncbi:hypothetical protein D9M73_280760 [compost metagenome]